VIESDGVALAEIDGEPFFRKTDAAAAGVDSFVAARRLREEAVDDHHVRKHYRSGAAVVDWYADDGRRIQEDAIPRLLRMTSPCSVRERCRLRKLRVPFLTQAT
jgi:hypothetical protein